MLSPKDDAMVHEAAAAGAAAAAAAAHRLLAGIVVDVEPTNTEVDVVPDGVTDAIPATVAVPYTLRLGDRVQLLFKNPRGCLVIGRWAGDWSPWEEFGENGAPFLNGWGHRTDSGELGEDKPGRASFRMLSGRVELSGWLQKLTGSANTAAQLRPDCLPPTRKTFVVSNGLAEPTTIQVNGPTHSVPGGIVSLLADTHICLDGISFSVTPSTSADPV